MEKSAERAELVAPAAAVSAEELAIEFGLVRELIEKHPPMRSKTPDPDVVKAVRDLFAKAGMSKPQFAAKLGGLISPTTIGSWTAGRRRYDKKTKTSKVVAQPASPSIRPALSEPNVLDRPPVTDDEAKLSPLSARALSTLDRATFNYGLDLARKNDPEGDFVAHNKQALLGVEFVRAVLERAGLRKGGAR